MNKYQTILNQASEIQGLATLVSIMTTPDIVSYVRSALEKNAATIRSEVERLLEAETAPSMRI